VRNSGGRRQIDFNALDCDLFRGLFRGRHRREIANDQNFLKSTAKSALDAYGDPKKWQA
jgi:hypothetical protein